MPGLLRSYYHAVLSNPELASKALAVSHSASANDLYFYCLIAEDHSNAVLGNPGAGGEPQRERQGLLLLLPGLLRTIAMQCWATRELAGKALAVSHSASANDLYFYCLIAEDP